MKCQKFENEISIEKRQIILVWPGILVWLVKGLYFSNFLIFSSTNSYYWDVFLRICNKFSEQNYLDKPVLINHSSVMSNTVTKTIKHFHQLIALGPQIAIKWKLHSSLSWSTPNTKLNYICNGLLQPICSATRNIWFDFLLKIHP